MHQRGLVSVVLAAIIAASAPSAALAGNVSLVANRLDFMASQGEANQVTVTSGDGQLMVTENGGMASLGTSDPTCTMDAGPPQVVSCPSAGVTTLVLSGGNLDDRLVNATALAAEAYGEDGRDTVRGGGGNERLEGGPGPDDVAGGGGNDRLYGATLQDPGAGADSDQLAGDGGDDRLFGSGGADHLAGGLGADHLEGADGADDLEGGDGADSIIGGNGDDVERGGPDNDTLGTEVTLGVVETSQELGNDALLGGPGDDILIPGPGPPLPDGDSISGGEGTDAVSYGARMAPVTVNKDGAADDGGLGERDNVGLDVERITGGLASDTLRGGPTPDVLAGGPGDDIVEGLAGDDELLGDAGGGDGNDTMMGGPGVDLVQGEGGGDKLSGDAGGDTVEGGDGEDTLRGGEGADTLKGGRARDVVAYNTQADVTVSLEAGDGRSRQPGDTDHIVQVEDVRGGNQRDTLTGTRKSNTLEGSGGEDYVDGRRGRDQLEGGRRADVVAARDGARDDPLSCGPGQDFAIVDRRDPFVKRGDNRCEQVDDGTQRVPTPGRVYVEPQRCTGSAEDVQLGLPTMHRLVPLRYSVMLPSGYRRRPAPTLDTADCPIHLTATPGQGRSATATISGGAVTVDQTSGRGVVTMLTVRSPKCAASAETASAAARAQRLRLSTRGRRGRWRVLGRYSIGASVGTDWTTLEHCTSTTTVVRRGRVQVFDRVRHRTVTVGAGHRYVSRAR
jgi:Ca2+-binding RTX toxin-like protein